MRFASGPKFSTSSIRGNCVLQERIVLIQSNAHTIAEANKKPVQIVMTENDYLCERIAFLIQEEKRIGEMAIFDSDPLYPYYTLSIGEKEFKIKTKKILNRIYTQLNGEKDKIKVFHCKSKKQKNEISI